MPNIADSLHGKVLLVTGATGFVAKGLVAKVLRHVPDIGRIYALVRTRRRSDGSVVSAQERLEQEVIPSSAFDGLRRELGDRFDVVIREKIRAVEFNLCRDRLAIPDADYERITAEVNVVVGIAATVVFDEPIDLALEQNTLGALRVLELARDCRDAVLVHVSTAYVNGQMTGEIAERSMAPNSTIAGIMSNGKAPRFDLDAEIERIGAFGVQVRREADTPAVTAELRRTLDQQNRGKRVTEHRITHQMDALRQRWIQKRLVDEGLRRGRELGWHDAYTMTKAMGEQLIERSRGNVPVAIVRPSIIESSLVDPEPGWLDGLKVADPLIAHYSKGRLVDFPANPEVVLDIVPVDIVANAILAVIPGLKERSEVRVYHAATGARNPILIGEIFQYVYEYFKQNPVMDRHGKPIVVQRWRFPSQKAFLRRVRFRYRLPLRLLKWLVGTLPFLPWGSSLPRRVSKAEATLARVVSLVNIYSPYTHLDCRFVTGNLESIQASLDPEERERFNLDVSRISWKVYVQDIHIPGLRRHVLKASDAAD